MRPRSITQTGTGSSNVINTDVHENPFCVSLFTLPTGTVTYTVQGTCDDLALGAPTNWFDHPSLTAKTQADGKVTSNYAYPVTGVRVTVTSGAGSVTLVVIQCGI